MWIILIVSVGILLLIISMCRIFRGSSTYMIQLRSYSWNTAARGKYRLSLLILQLLLSLPFSAVAHLLSMLFFSFDCHSKWFGYVVNSWKLSISQQRNGLHGGWNWTKYWLLYWSVEITGRAILQMYSITKENRLLGEARHSDVIAESSRP